MYAVILAGGSGTRLWPLSREQYPKQYLTFGRSGRSLFQETVARLIPKIPAEKIIVVTHRDQKSDLCRQLLNMDLDPCSVTLLSEPLSRNTAPAIGLAAWYLAERAGEGGVMAVLPSDHFIPAGAEYLELLSRGEAAARKYGLVTFGIAPQYPETGYGYIRRGRQLDSSGASAVECFVEKPDARQAAAYLEEGSFLWNSGMFVFRLGALMEAYRRHLPDMAAAFEGMDFSDEGSISAAYSGMASISIDYGIMEKAAGVAVIPAEIAWSDVGSFEAYYNISPKDDSDNCCEGRTLLVDTCGSLVLAGSRLVGAIGLKDMAVVETGDALLVCPLQRSQEVRELAAALEQGGHREFLHHRTVYRPWGSFTSLETGEGYQVKRLTVEPGRRLSLQSHRHRSENWVIVRGEALVTVGEKELPLRKGETVFIPAGARHRLENRSDGLLEVIEVQNGSYLGEDDIVRYEDDFGRIAGGGGLDPGKNYSRWLDNPSLDPEIRRELEDMSGDEALINASFSVELAFGTGGMRGIIGAGLSRMNRYTVRRATQGLADYINSLGLEARAKKVAIAYDTRRFSREFSMDAALTLAANGITALLFDGVRPTPQLSFALRELGCAAGIVITASHNPPQYNGYKVYGPDGGQAVSPFIDEVSAAISKVDLFDDVRSMSLEKAEKAGLLRFIGPEMDRAYRGAVKSLSLYRPGTRLKVVYTPLHGAGAAHIPHLLKESGYIDLLLVEEQMVPDPQFSTVDTPNPEDPAAFEMALELARREKADLALATDPDGDRAGCAVRSVDGTYRYLNGNEIGALLLDYLLGRLDEKGALPSNAVMLKTIVTGDLGKKVAGAYGVKTMETLTGFKYIGEKMKEFEETGEYRFVFGYEESYGFLAGNFGRDKDAVGAALLIAEMAAYHKEKGRTLLQALDQLSQKYGYFREELVSMGLRDMKKAGETMRSCEKLPPELAGERIVEKRDYSLRKSWDLLTGKERPLELPRSEVLFYRLESGAWFCIRPSGTEPKIKLYFSVSAAGPREAEARLHALKKEVLAHIE